MYGKRRMDLGVQGQKDKVSNPDGHSNCTTLGSSLELPASHFLQL